MILKLLKIIACVIASGLYSLLALLCYIMGVIPMAKIDDEIDPNHFLRMIWGKYNWKD